MTAKQELLAHLEGQHGAQVKERLAHQKLVLQHKGLHDNCRYLAHTHQPAGWTTGSDQIERRVFLSPPKNPSASRNQDRNWVLQIAEKGGGWRYEMAGTWQGDPEGAKTEADKILGYAANWVACGWGFQHQEVTA